MGIFSWLFRSRDKPQNSYHFSGWPFVFGKSAAGAKVNEFTVMQTTTIYACARILVEFIAGGLLECPRHIDNKKNLQK
jgi:phage portal protein BeeE